MVAAMATVLAARRHDSILGFLIFPSFRIVRIDDGHASATLQGKCPVSRF
jgi:hypothetical protein